MLKKDQLKELEYWNNFYSKHRNDNFAFIPSQFCCLMAIELNKYDTIIEFGCGNARDSFFLARHGFNIVAVDLSDEVIEINNKHSIQIDNISFICADVSKNSDIKNCILQARNYSNVDNIVIYTRFFLHTLDEQQEDLFLKALSNFLIKGDKLYFEFRTDKDKDKDKVYNNHFRRFVNLYDTITKLNDYGFNIEYSIESNGLAKFKEEDPIVGRIIAIKS